MRVLVVADETAIIKFLEKKILIKSSTALEILKWNLFENRAVISIFRHLGQNEFLKCPDS